MTPPDERNVIVVTDIAVPTGRRDTLLTFSEAETVLNRCYRCSSDSEVENTGMVFWTDKPVDSYDEYFYAGFGDHRCGTVTIFVGDHGADVFTAKDGDIDRLLGAGRRGPYPFA